LILFKQALRGFLALHISLKKRPDTVGEPLFWFLLAQL
jgi:hypothetical protein